VGTAEAVEGRHIKLAKTDPAARGVHHYIELSKVAPVDGGKVRLNVPALHALGAVAGTLKPDPAKARARDAAHDGSLALAGSITAAHGQGGPTASDAVPPAAAPTAPAEIQPGHPGDGGQSTVVAPSKGESGPQTAAPAPLPPSAGADTPGGSARGGVIATPPTAGDAEINKSAPRAGSDAMPVIPPPGAPGSGNPRVVPK
jgi:Uncharacterized protein conserved in bacteria (DUF2171)